MRLKINLAEYSVKTQEKVWKILDREDRQYVNQSQKLDKLLSQPLRNDDLKADYIRQHLSFDIDALIASGAWLHSESPELVKLAEFGRMTKTSRKLGFKVSVITAGPKKGRVGTTRYLGLIMRLFGCTLEKKQIRFDGGKRNLYRIIPQ